MNIDIRIVPPVLVVSSPSFAPPPELVPNVSWGWGALPWPGRARVTTTGEIEAVTATTTFTEAIYIYLPGATTD